MKYVCPNIPLPVSRFPPTCVPISPYLPSFVSQYPPVTIRSIRGTIPISAPSSGPMMGRRVTTTAISKRLTTAHYTNSDTVYTMQCMRNSEGRGGERESLPGKDRKTLAQEHTKNRVLDFGGNGQFFAVTTAPR